MLGRVAAQLAEPGKAASTEADPKAALGSKLGKSKLGMSRVDGHSPAESSKVSGSKVGAADGSSDGGALPPWVWLVGAVPFCAHTVSNSVMFVAQMAFFNRVSDPKIGGTYMTMLNTISNLGGQWPGPAILSAKAALEAYPTVDAFAVVAVGGVALSLAWLAAFSGRAAALQSMAIKQWHA